MKKKSIIILFIIFIIIFIITSIKIIFWFLDNNKTNKQIKDINDIVKTEDITNIDNKKIITMNFDKLKKINPDTMGWIQVNGTNINYPFVQTKDNKFYLNHSFDKSYNQAGWVFMDYRNNIKFFDKNTILYAHGRLDKTMFGTLKNIIKNKWYSNTNNHLIKLSTEYENNIWEVFSVYHIKTTSDYIKTEFNNDTDFNNFLDLITNRSIYKFKVKLDKNDKIITLSTCYNNTEKVVMHAKLIKSEKK